MWRQLNTPALIFSVVSLGNFSYKNKNAMSVYCLHKFFIMNTPALIFSVLSLGNFSYKNKNAMSVYCLHKFFIMPNLICSGGNKTLHISTRGWWATHMFFVPGVCGLNRLVLLAAVNTFGMTTHFFFRNNRLWCNLSAVPPKCHLPSDHHKCAIYMSCSSWI